MAQMPEDRPVETNLADTEGLPTHRGRDVGGIADGASRSVAELSGAFTGPGGFSGNGKVRVDAQDLSLTHRSVAALLCYFFPALLTGIGGAVGLVAANLLLGEAHEYVVLIALAAPMVLFGMVAWLMLRSSTRMHRHGHQQGGITNDESAEGPNPASST